MLVSLLNKSFSVFLSESTFLLVTKLISFYSPRFLFLKKSPPEVERDPPAHSSDPSRGLRPWQYIYHGDELYLNDADLRPGHHLAVDQTPIKEKRSIWSWQWLLIWSGYAIRITDTISKVDWLQNDLLALFNCHWNESNCQWTLLCHW